MARNKERKCNAKHRVSARYDRNGHYRVRHAFCDRPAVAVDIYGLGYCADHKGQGDYGRVEVDLDEVLADLINHLR